MRIAGLQKCSFVDYPGKLAAVVFTPDCNMDCFYCHNPSLLHEGDAPTQTPADVLAFLDKRRAYLEAVVVTGGEATLQDGLGEFLAAVRAMGYAIKLDTNGSRPGVLADLLARGLVDFVAMDLKAPLPKYPDITRRAGDRADIEQSIDLLLAGRVDYEFRTTLAPPLTVEDVMLMALRIRGAKRYVLQQYRTPQVPHADRLPKPWPDVYIWSAAQAAGEYVAACTVRGIDTKRFDTCPHTGPALAAATAG